MRETKFVAKMGLASVCDKIGTSHSASKKFGTSRSARHFCRLEQEVAARHQNAGEGEAR